MTDERMGLPSASSMERIFLCRGSHALCKGLASSGSKASELGDQVHRTLETGEAAPTHTAEDIAKRIAQLRAEVIAATLGEGELQVWKEKRLWREGFDRRPLYSGRPDWVGAMRKGDAIGGLVIDYKSGRGEVQDASSNLQLRTQVVLAADLIGQHFSGDRPDVIYAAIIQPFADQEFHVTRFPGKSIYVIQAQIDALAIQAEMGPTIRVAGVKQCRYCPAKAICPEAASFAQLPELKVKPDEEPADIARRLTPEQLLRVWEKRTVIESILSAVTDRLKELPPEQMETLGLHLKEGRRIRDITDPRRVFQRATKIGVPQSAFLECVDIGLGKLTEQVRAATGDVGAELKAEMERLLEGCTEERRAKPTLERRKK